MLVGIQGSGKTTYSRILSQKENIPIVSTDGIRDEDPTIEGDDVFTLAYDRVAQHLNEGKGVIFDATNITPQVRKRFLDNLVKRGIDLSKYEIYVHYFVPNTELCVERVNRRNTIPGERLLPIEVVYSYAKNIVKPTLEEGFTKIITIDNYELY